MLARTLIFMLFSFSYFSTASAVKLPWSATYDCPEWNAMQGSNGAEICEGVEKSGSGKTYDGNVEQITSQANYPKGGGGRGQRHWIGDGNGGVNDYSGGTVVHFSGEREIWVRWYMRFQDGFYWEDYQGFKVLYFLEKEWAVHNYYMIAKWSRGGLEYYTNGGDNNWYRPTPDWGWVDIFGGAVSDGSWHLYEVHIKSETGPGKSDGVFQAWVDGVLRVDAHDVDHGLASQNKNLVGFYIGSNAKVFPAGVPDMYVDYDDFYITNQTPSKRDAHGNPMIGPLSTDTNDTLNAPTNLRIVE